MKPRNQRENERTVHPHGSLHLCDAIVVFQLRNLLRILGIEPHNMEGLSTVKQPEHEVTFNESGGTDDKYAFHIEFAININPS